MSYVLLLFFSLTFGCNRPPSSYPEYLLPILENMTTTERQADCFLIIPLEGCETCIKQTLEYQARLKEMGEHGIVLTRIVTRRYAENFLRAYELGSLPIYYDVENQLDKRGFNSAYPVFISKSQQTVLNTSVTFNDFREVLKFCKNK